MRVENASATELQPGYREALIDLLYQLADDELVIGHRSAEWLGVAPDIEEDIAFSSMTQDEIGHATFYYGLLNDLGEASPDELAFARQAAYFRNACALERPNGDWAHAIARGFFYDTFEAIRLEMLVASSYVPLAQGAVKIQREEHYHLLHMETWFQRLAIAGGEAKERLEKAVAEIWTDLGDLFSLGKHASTLVSEEIFPLDYAHFYARWQTRIQTIFQDIGLEWPGPITKTEGQDGRTGEHTADLEQMLLLMSEVYRIDPAANW